VNDRSTRRRGQGLCAGQRLSQRAGQRADYLNGAEESLHSSFSLVFKKLHISSIDG
jgi:hypothetical protein